MNINITWHGDNFNVELIGKDGEAFLSVRGCRIVDGSKGSFVSYPARKLDSGKYWNHAYGSDKFNAAVLEKALASRPAGGRRDSDVPF